MTQEEFLSEMDTRKSGASENSLLRFEKSLGTRLPTQYRQFLKRCNGGYCGGTVLFKRNGPSVHHIFGLRGELSLPWLLDLRNQGKGPPIPHDIFPIMDDPGGQAICIGLSKAKSGQIYYWVDGKTRRLAKSLAEFIRGLKVRNPDAFEDDDE